MYVGMWATVSKCALTVVPNQWLKYSGHWFQTMSFNLNVHRGIIKCTLIIFFLYLSIILAVFVVIWLLHTVYEVATSTLNKIADFFFFLQLYQCRTASR